MIIGANVSCMLYDVKNGKDTSRGFGNQQLLLPLIEYFSPLSLYLFSFDTKTIMAGDDEFYVRY